MMPIQIDTGQPSRRARRQVVPCFAGHRAGSWRSAAPACFLGDATRVANPGNAGREGIAMTTKRHTRHLAPRST